MISIRSSRLCVLATLAYINYVQRVEYVHIYIHIFTYDLSFVIYFFTRKFMFLLLIENCRTIPFLIKKVLLNELGCMMMC